MTVLWGIDIFMDIFGAHCTISMGYFLNQLLVIAVFCDETHYENTSMQYTAIFHGCSNEYPQYMF